MYLPFVEGPAFSLLGFVLGTLAITRFFDVTLKPSGLVNICFTVLVFSSVQLCFGLAIRLSPLFTVGSRCDLPDDFQFPLQVVFVGPIV